MARMEVGKERLAISQLLWVLYSVSFLGEDVACSPAPQNARRLVQYSMDERLKKKSRRLLA